MSAQGPGCVKTPTRGKRAELFSPFSSFYGACQGDSFLIPRYRDKRSTRKFDVGVFTQPGSKTEVAALRRDVCFTPESGHWTDIPGGPFSANKRHHDPPLR